MPRCRNWRPSRPTSTVPTPAWRPPGGAFASSGSAWRRGARAPTPPASSATCWSIGCFRGSASSNSGVARSASGASIWPPTATVTSRSTSAGSACGTRTSRRWCATGAHRWLSRSSGPPAASLSALPAAAASSAAAAACWGSTTSTSRRTGSISMMSTCRARAGTSRTRHCRQSSRRLAPGVSATPPPRSRPSRTTSSVPRYRVFSSSREGPVPARPWWRCTGPPT